MTGFGDAEYQTPGELHRRTYSNCRFREYHILMRQVNRSSEGPVYGMNQVVFGVCTIRATISTDT